MNVVATFNLAYNGGVMVREGIGYMLIFDRLVCTAPGTGLCFRPLDPPLETTLHVVWRKGRMSTPVTETILDTMMAESGDAGER